MSEICLCCQSQDVKEDEETTEDPIKKMRTEIDSGGEQKFRFCSRSAFLTYPRCPILPRNYLSAISDLTGSKSRLLSKARETP